ncbi:aminomethyltransferase family protein [Desulfitobacterium chlororespirans]|uniref:Aminomethyltransferase n=1 Tax=Desulfitobacterium chlororespirans DSM 11544 TaxID=1121395 RepID=A0A1M7SNR4_9FIRM|nr:aminomethyltransferase family protein [Desulfitobacterium chlororespirans]SHN60121.1 aminomethyltransferase [Desulfitobacterium chlororespirans DSM 11544]
MFKNVYKDDAAKREQHEAVRNKVGWYHFTHQLLEVTGEDATAFLDRIHANPIATLKVGSERYTTILNEDGVIIDDVVVFRLEENKYWISTLYVNKLVKWLDAYKGESKVEYRNITGAWAMYAVQGPLSKELLNCFLAEKIDDQKFFTIRDNKIGDVLVKVNRAGFAGEKVGYEIYIAPEKAALVEAKLEECGKAFGAVRVTEFQLMVWTLPAEKGFYLMCDLNGTNPLEVGLERGIDWNKDFIGKEALVKVKEEGPKRRMLGFTVDEEDMHIETRSLGSSGAPILLDGEEVGRVRKLTYGYTVGKNIGYALVDSGKANIGDKVIINGFEATLTDKVFC